MVETWEEHEAAWAVERERKRVARACFCVCDCAKPARNFQVLFGDQSMGLCQSCTDQRDTKRVIHRLQRSAMDTWNDPLIAEDLTAAMAYVTAYEGTSNTMHAFQARLGEGKDLTPLMVDRILRMQAHEAYLEAAAEKRFVKALKADDTGVQVDLSELPEGTTNYAVPLTGDPDLLAFIRIQRPKRGQWQGFTFVSHLIGPQSVRYGMQLPGARQTYRGRFSGLLARLMANPAAARERYAQLDVRVDKPAESVVGSAGHPSKQQEVPIEPSQPPRPPQRARPGIPDADRRDGGGQLGIGVAEPF